MTQMMFLLGGHDLEMITIRDVLEQRGVQFLDKNLHWENASLSQYKREILTYLRKPSIENVTLWGVELRNDLQLSVNERKIFDSIYHVIDHHGDKPSRPSSLEQVAQVIGYELTYEERLVAIHDAEYIPGLEKEGLSPAQIEAILRKDREAQGVTPEDEEEAAKCIAGQEHYGPLTLVRTSSKRFSPISDRLYPYKSLLIISRPYGSFCYYGARSYEMASLADDNWLTYSGGGKSGYWGGSLRPGLSSEERNEKLEALIKMIALRLQHSF